MQGLRSTTILEGLRFPSTGAAPWHRIGRATEVRHLHPRTQLQGAVASYGMVRVLGESDQPALEEFLARHADSSMFLLANSRKAGLADRGLPFQATYAGAFQGARIRAVAAHSWLGSVLLQAPEKLAEVVRAAVQASGRRATAILGPYAQAIAAADALGARSLEHEGRELLFGLDLRALRVPEALASGRLVCRRPREDELPLLTDWRADYV